MDRPNRIRDKFHGIQKILAIIVRSILRIKPWFECRIRVPSCYVRSALPSSP
jgi:hypothetical protein